MAGALVAAVLPPSGLTRNVCRLVREEIVLVLPLPIPRFHPLDETSVLVLLGDSLPLAMTWSAEAGSRLRLPKTSIAGGHLVGIVHRQASENYPVDACVSGDGKVEEEGARSVYPFRWRKHSPCTCTLDELVGEGRQGSMLWYLQPPHCVYRTGPGYRPPYPRFSKSSRMPSTEVLS